MTSKSKFTGIATGGGPDPDHRTDPICIRTMKGFLLQDNAVHSTVLRSGTIILNTLVQPLSGHVPVAGTVNVGNPAGSGHEYANATAVTAASLTALTLTQLVGAQRVNFQCASLTAGSAVYVALEVIEQAQISGR